MNPSPEEALFALALTKPAAERAGWLDRECEGDAALRARLEALLAAHEQPETLLTTQADSGRPTIKLDLANAPDEAVGQTLGRYKLLERVGEGGCGMVYVAEQTEPVRRRVAMMDHADEVTPYQNPPVPKPPHYAPKADLAILSTGISGLVAAPRRMSRALTCDRRLVEVRCCRSHRVDWVGSAIQGSLTRCPSFRAQSKDARNLGDWSGSSSEYCSSPQLPHLLHSPTLEKWQSSSPPAASQAA